LANEATRRGRERAANDQPGAELEQVPGSAVQRQMVRKPSRTRTSAPSSGGSPADRSIRLGTWFQYDGLAQEKYAGRAN
jgi:hypothetical protein